MTTLYHPACVSSAPTTSGIYKISNLVTGKCYIGSSVNLQRRWQEHYYDLCKNQHYNAKLQRTWNKHTESAFRFEIIELVLSAFLLEREQYWLDRIKPYERNKGYNLNKYANSCLGTKRSPETIEKHRIASTGKKHTDEAKAKISHANKGRHHAPEEDTPKMKALIITDPQGNEYPILGIKKFCDEHSLSRAALMLVAKGKQAQHKGYKARYPGDDPQEPKPPKRRERISKPPRVKKKRSYGQYEWHRKNMILTDPNGIEYIVHGVNGFCKEHGLDSSCITKVAKGIHSQHRGWKARFPDSDVA